MRATHECLHNQRKGVDHIRSDKDVEYRLEGHHYDAVNAACTTNDTTVAPINYLDLVWHISLPVAEDSAVNRE